MRCCTGTAAWSPGAVSTLGTWLFCSEPGGGMTKMEIALSMEPLRCGSRLGSALVGWIQRFQVGYSGGSLEKTRAIDISCNSVWIGPADIMRGHWMDCTFGAMAGHCLDCTCRCYGGSSCGFAFRRRIVALIVGVLTLGVDKYVHVNRKYWCSMAVDKTNWFCDWWVLTLNVAIIQAANAEVRWRWAMQNNYVTGGALMLDVGRCSYRLNVLMC